MGSYGEIVFYQKVMFKDEKIFSNFTIYTYFFFIFPLKFFHNFRLTSFGENQLKLRIIKIDNHTTLHWKGGKHFEFEQWFTSFPVF